MSKKRTNMEIGMLDLLKAVNLSVERKDLKLKDLQFVAPDFHGFLDHHMIYFMGDSNGRQSNWKN